jgi:hypothetical protein
LVNTICKPVSTFLVVGGSFSSIRSTRKLASNFVPFQMVWKALHTFQSGSMHCRYLKAFRR